MGCLSSNPRQLAPEVYEQPKINIRHSQFKKFPSTLPADSLLNNPNARHIQKQMKGEENTQTRGTALESLLRTVDRRTNCSSQSYVYNCIGSLIFINSTVENDTKKDKIYWGTGFMISPCLVLTAAHLVQKHRTIGNRPLLFIIKENQDEDSLSLLANAIEIEKSYFHDDYDSTEMILAKDYALLKLSKAIHRERYLPLGANLGEKHIPATIAGYPQHQTVQFTAVAMTGLIQQNKKDQLSYDIDTTPGQSGSPIFLQYGPNINLVVGIHSGKSPRSSFNSGCKITSETVAVIKKWILNIRKESNSKDMHLASVDLSNVQLKIHSKILALGKNTMNESQILQMSKSNEFSLETDQPSELYMIAKFMFGKRQFHKSLACLQKALLQWKDNFLVKARILKLLGCNYQQLTQYEIALYYYNKSLSIFHSISKNGKQTIQLLNNIGNLYIQMKQISKAQKYYNIIRLGVKDMDEKESENKIVNLTNNALIYLEKKEFKKAKVELEKALKMEQSLFDYLTEGKALILNGLSTASFELADYENWIQYSFGCLAVMGTLGFRTQQNFLVEADSFYLKLNQIMETKDPSLSFLVKVAKVIKLLDLKAQNTMTKVRQQLFERIDNKLALTAQDIQ